MNETIRDKENFKIKSILFVYGRGLCVYGLGGYSECSAQRAQKRASDSLELELTDVCKAPYVGARNRTWVL